MTIQQHASDESLMRYALGSLSVGPGIIVGAHLEACSACRARLQAFSAAGGVLLEDADAASLQPDALAQALARIDGPGSLAQPAPAPRIGDIALPAALRGCHIGRFWPVAPGVRLSRIRVPAAPEANIVLFRVQAARAMPAHGHTGAEYIQVLTGSFHDGHTRYAAGDLSEADGDTDHHPVIDAAGECVSLAAVEGPARMHGFLARLIQPLVGL